MVSVFKKMEKLYFNEENILLESNGKHGYAYESPDVDDDAYNDGETANKSIQDLKNLKATGKPFFSSRWICKTTFTF